jgi:hypothetical protein
VASAELGRIGPVERDAMSTLRGALVLASGVQGGGAHPPPDEPLLLAIVIGGLTLLCIPIAIYMRNRSRRRRPVTDQWGALAVMGELCPEGWQAQITLYGWGAPVPADAPASRVPLVELEWKQFEEESGRVVVARRVWAPTIVQALQMMVEDRRTDITLEEIEQAAAEDGDSPWGE